MIAVFRFRVSPSKNSRNRKKVQSSCLLYFLHIALVKMKRELPFSEVKRYSSSLSLRLHPAGRTRCFHAELCRTWVSTTGLGVLFNLRINPQVTGPCIGAFQVSKTASVTQSILHSTDGLFGCYE